MSTTSDERTRPSHSRHILREVDKIVQGNPSDPAAAEMLSALRGLGPDAAQMIDQILLGRIGQQRSAIEDTREILDQLQEEIDKLTAAPWVPGRFLRLDMSRDRTCALVHAAGAMRLVELSDEVDADALGRGAWVYLNGQQGVLMAIADGELQACGETGFFDRCTPDGRLVMNHRDEELLFDAGADLDASTLSPGDEVRIDRGALLALERIEAPGADRYRVDDEDNSIGAEGIGGQSECWRELMAFLTARLLEPKLADRYHITGKRSVLLCGPPGNGKTLMARSVATEIGRLTRRKCSFFVLKPGELETSYVGSTQANIRRFFEGVRKATKHGSVIVFIDEVEAIARHRGGLGGHHSDRFVAAWLAEIDGFADLGDVAMVSATNRMDLLDAAFLDRIAEKAIEVPRPDARSAREIFEIHLPSTVPVAPNGPAATQTRRDLIEAAVSHLYAPNGPSELCTLQLRDGKRRTVHASDLLNGRLIQQICRNACLDAYHRDRTTGKAGVHLGDMDAAVTATLTRLTKTLTVRNARNYLSDLPDDVDVVRVEPRSRQVERPLQYVVVD